MHDTLNTRYDVLKERFIYHAELVGKYDFPQLPEVHAHPEGLRAVPFNLAKNEKRPKECILHHFAMITGSKRSGITLASISR